MLYLNIFFVLTSLWNFNEFRYLWSILGVKHFYMKHDEAFLSSMLYITSAWTKLDNIFKLLTLKHSWREALFLLFDFLGFKFGMAQTKCAVTQVLSHYRISVNKKTKEPLKMDPLYFFTTPIGGLWLDFKKLE